MTPNAISVQIDGHVVGYLPRATAQEYLPGLRGSNGPTQAPTLRCAG